MPYKITYLVNVDWVPAGSNIRIGNTKQFAKTSAGAVQTQTFTASDITTLLNQMTTDLSAQMGASAVLTQIQGWASGGN